MKVLSILFLIVSLFVFQSCNNSGNKAKDLNKPLVEGMKNFDLKELGLNIIVPAPVNAEVKASGSGVEINQGENFSLFVASGTGDMNLFKTDIKNDEVRKFIRYVLEEPETIIYECETAGKVEFHFYSIKKSEKDVVEFRDNNNLVFSEAQINKMVDCSKASVLN